MSLAIDNLEIDGLVLGSGNPTRKAVRAGTIGPGNLATDFENGDTLDGVTLITGNRILIKNQTSGVENGIYEVQASGAPVRAVDYEEDTPGGGITVYVQEGTVLQDTGWFCINDDGSDIIGSDALVYQQTTGTGVDGDMHGPGSSVTDNAIVRWDGTGGMTVQNSGVAIDDSNNVVAVNSIQWSGGANNARIIATAQTSGLGTFNLPNLAGSTTDIVGTSISQTITNKTFSTGNTWNGNTISVSRGGTGVTTHGSGNVLVGNGTGAILSTKAAPSGNFVGTTDTQTLSAKTLITPIIAQISNSGILTLPSGTTDTLVARNTTDTLTNKTLTSPRIGTAILDINGNELLTFTATGSAVNEINLANASTGTNPRLSATGGDSNIGMDFQVKGNGAYRFLGTTSTSAQVQLYEDVDNGSNYTAWAAPASVSTTTTLRMPDGVGTSGQVLSTDGSNPATLAWTTIDTSITSVSATSTATTSTTSSTYVLINSMSITPAAGTYLIMFSSSGEVSTSNSNGLYAIFSAGSIVSHSVRRYNANFFTNDFLERALHSQAITTVNGSQDIDVRYQVDVGSFTIYERSLIAIKLS